MIIKLYFAKVQHLPLTELEDTLHKIRDIVLEKERAELARIRYDVPDITKPTLSKILKSFDENQDKDAIFKIGAIRPGSVELTIVLTAFGYWILDKTLGDTLTETWKETDLNHRIKKFFLKGKKDKLKAIEKEINKPNYPLMYRARFRRKKEIEEVEIPMFARSDLEREEVGVRITIEDDLYGEPLDIPPTYNDLDETPNKPQQDGIDND
ncbi:MAG: hypothetical protein AAGH40_09275 [Verrucomicrobiota bacterium]